MRQGLVDQQYYYKEQDPQYMGEPLPSQLANGPTQQRKCRDLLFLILYLAFWAGLIVVACIAFSKGQPHLLAAPFDMSGQQCGYSSGYQDYQYVYFDKYNTSKFACITSCPGTSGLTNQSCRLNNTNFNCLLYGNYSTYQFVGVCYPNDDALADTIQLGLSFFDEAIADLQNTWPISLTMIFMALIASLLVLFFIRACGGCLVVSVIVLYFAGLLTMGFIFLLTAQGKIKIKALDNMGNLPLLKTIGIIAFSVAGISFLVVLCCVRKIKIGIMVIKTTAQFTQQQCQTILVPIFMFITISMFFAFWVTVSIFIFSSGTIGQCGGSPYACIDWDVGVKRSLGYYFFGLFWNCEVAIGMCQFVLASTTAYWYFSHLSNQKTSSPVCKSFCRGMFYHLGSIAFGALILCLLIILQLIFQVLHSASKKQSISNDPVTNACSKCCISYVRCALACFQRFIRFISMNAFIMMAITGSGFCTAAHEAFYLILRSSAAYAISHGVGRLIMFFGKLMITTICTVSGYFMITTIDHFSSQIFSPVMPTIMFFVISYVISCLFMDVFAVGSDTLLLCYCLERDIHKGQAKSCPANLHAVLQNN